MIRSTAFKIARAGSSTLSSSSASLSTSLSTSLAKQTKLIASQSNTTFLNPNHRYRRCLSSSSSSSSSTTTTEEGGGKKILFDIVPKDDFG
jgi:hypothetical protein